MSTVIISQIEILNNPCSFLSPFSFDISYQAYQQLEEALEWKIIYVGSAENSKFDQVLDVVQVGPINVGTYRFVFDADAPDPKRIPVDDLVGVTLVMLTGNYKDQEFVRVGYYVNNEYTDEDMMDNPPEVPEIDKLQRNIKADAPRVTTFQIPWDSQASMPVEQTNSIPPGFEQTNSQSIRVSQDDMNMDVDSQVQQQQYQQQQIDNRSYVKQFLQEYKQNGSTDQTELLKQENYGQMQAQNRGQEDMQDFMQQQQIQPDGIQMNDIEF